MIFRDTERYQDCISWIPGNEETTTIRLITTTVEPPRQLGRLNKSDNQIPGVGFNGKLLIVDLSLNQVKSVEEYE